MMQDRLIEGSLYYIKSDLVWEWLPAILIKPDTWEYVKSKVHVGFDEITNWLLIPTAEEIMAKRKFIETRCKIKISKGAKGWSIPCCFLEPEEEVHLEKMNKALKKYKKRENAQRGKA